MIHCYQIVRHNSVYNSLSCRAQKFRCLEGLRSQALVNNEMPRFSCTALCFYKNLFLYKTVLKLKYCKVKNIPNADILLTTFCMLIEFKVQ